MKKKKFRILMLKKNGLPHYASVIDNGNALSTVKSKEIESPFLLWIKKHKRWKDYFCEFLYQNLDARAFTFLLEQLQLKKNSNYMKMKLAQFYFKMYKIMSREDYYDKGWKLVKDASAGTSSSIIAKHYLFFMEKRKKNYQRAFQLAREIIASSPQYIYMYHDLAHLYIHLGYRKGYLSFLKLFEKRFHQSIVPKMNYLMYLKKYNIPQYLHLSETFLKKHFNRSHLFYTVNILISRGEYSRALNLEKIFLKYNFKSSFINLLIRTEQYTRAKKILFKKIIKNEKAEDYLRLGKIEMALNLDPGLYWLRLLSLTPGNRAIEEYSSYVERKKFVLPYEKYLRSSKFKQTEFKQDNVNNNSYTVLYRGRIFDFKSATSGFLICQDIIRINTERGASQLGEYKITSNEPAFLVKAEVVKNGIRHQVHKIHNVNGSIYISLSGLTKGSVIHVIYVKNDFIRSAHESRYISQPSYFLQKYEEPVHTMSVVILKPSSLFLNIYSNRNWNFKKKQLNGITVYQYSGKDFSSLKRELYSGSSKQFFALSQVLILQKIKKK
jgi:hypothetical protein